MRRHATGIRTLCLLLGLSLAACDNGANKIAFEMRYYLPGNPTGGDLIFKTPFGQKVSGAIPVPTPDYSSPFAAQYTLSFVTPFPRETGDFQIDFATGQWTYTPARGYTGDIIVPFRLDATYFGKVAEGRLIIQVGSDLQRLKPALAVRATGCIMCHAQVHSRVVTDFGAGDPYFFGGGALDPQSGSVYGNHAENWASAQVWSDIIVPKASVPGLNGLPAGQSLAAYLRSRVVAPDAQSAVPAVIERERVYIGAPTESQVRALLGEVTAVYPYRYQPHDETSPALAGLELDPTGSFLTNDGVLACDGDLVVDRPLLLDHLVLTTVQGCRIYSTRAVFIQGAIGYGDSPATANLQIASSRAIMLGLGKLNPDGSAEPFNNHIVSDTLAYRLVDFWTVPGFFVRGGLTPSQAGNAIVADAGGMNLLDARNDPAGRGIAFERLALVAPHIQSRYNGNFSGSVVAEIAIFALGNFHFKFDDVFQAVEVLPLLPARSILDVSSE